MENSKQATMDNQSTTATLPSVLERADSGGSTSSAISARSSSACSSLFSQAGGAGSDEERRSSFASSVFVDDKEEAEEDILEGSVTPSPQLPDAIPSSLSMHPVLDSSDSSRPSSSSDGASSHGSFISTTDMATPTAELYALSLQPLTASSALSSPVTAGPNSSAGGGPSASSSSATSSTKTPTSSASTDTNKLIIDTSSVSIQRSSAKGTLPPATSPEMLRFAQRVASRGIPLFPARSNSHSHMQSSTMNSAKAVAAAAAIVASSSSSGGRIMKAEGFPWTARPSSYTPRSASLSSSSSKPPHTGQSYNASSSSSSASKSAKALVATPSAIFSAGEDESEDETEALSSLFPSTYSTRPATSPSSSSSSSFNFNANGSTALHHAMRNSQSCAGSNAVHPLSSNSSSNATIRHSHCSSNNTTNESTASTTMLSSSSYRFGNGGNGEPGSSDVSLMSPTNTYSTIKMNHGESDRQAQRTDVELHQDYDMDEGRNAIELKRDIRSGHSSTPRTRSTGTSSSTTVGAAGSGGILQGQGAPASSSSSSGCIGSSSEMKHCGPARPAAGSSSSSSSFSSHTPQQQQHLSEDKSSTTSIDRKKKDATVSTASSSSLFRYEAPMAATMVLPSCASISVPPPPPSTTNRQETVPLSLSTRLGSHHSLPPVLSSSYGSIDASKKNAGGGDVTGTVADGLNSNFTSLSSKSKESAALSLPTSTSVLDSNNARAKDAPKNTTRNASLDYSDARGNLYTSHLNSLNYHAGMNDNTYSSSPSSAVTAMNNMHNGTSVGAGVGGRPATASSIYGISTTSTTTRPWIRDSDASSVRSSSGLSSEGSSFDGQYYGNGNSDIEPNVMSPAAPPPVPFLSTAPAPPGCKITVDALQPDGFDVYITLPGFSYENITLALKRNGALHILADKYDGSAGHFERMVELGDGARNCKVTAEFNGQRLKVLMRKKDNGKNGKLGGASNASSSTSSSSASSYTTSSSITSAMMMNNRNSDQLSYDPTLAMMMPSSASATASSIHSSSSSNSSSPIVPHGSYSPHLYYGGTDPVAFYSSSPTMFGTSIIGKTSTAVHPSTVNNGRRSMTSPPSYP